MVVVIFIFGMIYPFLLNVPFYVYFICWMVPGVILAFIYVFASMGCYYVWLLFPFGSLLALMGAWVAGTSYIFVNIIPPSSPYFGFIYTVMMKLFETMVLQVTHFSFPY
eukprot:149131_1